MNNYLWIIRYVIPYRKYALLNILFNVLSVLFSLVSLTMVVPFLGLLFGKTKPVHDMPAQMSSPDEIIQYFYFQLTQIIESQGKEQALLIICGMVMVLFFFKNLFRYLGMYFIAPVRNGISKDIRSDLHTKVLQLPLSFFTGERKGDLMARMTNDVQEIEWSVLSSIEAVFRDPIAIASFLFTLFYMSPQLTVFVLILLPVTGAIIGSIARSLRKNSAEGQAKLGLLLSVIEETLSGLRIIKSFTSEQFVSRKFDAINLDFLRIGNQMFRKRDLAAPLGEFLGAMVLVTVMWFGGKLVFSGAGLEPQVFIAYVAIFSQIIPPAKSFTAAFYNVQKGIASVDRVRWILDAENKVTDKANAIEKSSFDSEISYENVSFAYGKDNVLRNIDLTISKGKSIALVGQSGAGKTTLADLLPRFYDCTEGRVTIDGVSIKDLKINALRNLTGIVTQESILFNDTVFNNIAFGMAAVRKEDVIHAAKVANAHEFIVQMENGYETNIGDRGSKLSGGQRQRISIARAVLKNPPILILDEATSSLDTESEKLVQDALVHLMENRTSLIIAHRLSTIQHADEIIVMSQGEIVERGNHATLIQHDGAYKKLFEMQSFV